MPAFSQSLEASLHRALEYANERNHEYATLEHLLLALLDDRDAAIKMGAIKPGKAGESELLARINHADPKEIMPPVKSRRTLTAAQKDILKRWIAEGAEYQLHWSLLAPKRPPLPDVKNKEGVRNPIDRFIIAELEKRGMKLNPEADRRTLARRLSLDLIGLPPTSAEVAACQPFLERQIELLRPRLMVFLGGAAARALLGLQEGVTKLRGRSLTYTTAQRASIPALVTFHPAFLLRQPAQKRLAWRDLLAIKELLRSG